MKDDNTPYKVFTPFYKKAYLALDNIRKNRDENESSDFLIDAINKFESIEDRYAAGAARIFLKDVMPTPPTLDDDDSDDE